MWIFNSYGEHNGSKKTAGVKEKVLREGCTRYPKRYFINFFLLAFPSLRVVKIPIKPSASCATFHMLLFFPECFSFSLHLSSVRASGGESESKRRTSFTLTERFVFSFLSPRGKQRRHRFFFAMVKRERLLNFIVFQLALSLRLIHFSLAAIFSTDFFLPHFVKTTKQKANILFHSFEHKLVVILRQSIVGILRLFILTNADVAPGGRMGRRKPRNIKRLSNVNAKPEE